MASLLKSKKLLFALATVIIVLLNLYTFSFAYPTMDHALVFGGKVEPRDFSVYYIAAWRMFHNPSQIFTVGALNDGEPAIYPYLTPYKYLPSFLVLISPLINLSYYQAFWVFDAFEFALLPIMALLLYKLLENKNPIATILIFIIVLVLPYPIPGTGFSNGYYMSWVEGQAKILLTFLFLLSFYFGYKGRAGLSGVAFALGAFDPRFAIMALPLFLFYNRGKLKTALGVAAIVLFAFNIVVFYPGTAQGFVSMVFDSGITTPFYTFTWIPVAMIVSLIAVNMKQMADEWKKFWLRFSAKQKNALSV